MKTRFDGTQKRRPLFVIGESHVDLEVQQAVAGTLEYVYGAFGARVIASEGFAGPLPLPARFGSESARYAAARADFLGREINAVEYMALAYPDVRVHGVEDMEAYEEHGKALTDLNSRFKTWNDKFQSFFETDLATLRVTQQDGDRIVEALKSGLETGEFGGFQKTLCQATGTSSRVCLKCEELVKEAGELKKMGDAMTSPDHHYMRSRDEKLVSHSLHLTLGDPDVLVVGYLHLAGVERELRSRGFPYLTIVPPGVEDQIKKGPMPPEDEEVWKRWTEAQPTVFEKWLGTKHKPIPALTRAGFRRQSEVFNALVLADHLLVGGSGEQEVIRLLSQGTFPVAFRVEHCFQVEGGHAIAFRAGDEVGYAYFTDAPLSLPPPQGARELKRGDLPGDRQYVIYGGSPPIIGPPSPPSGVDPFRGMRVAVEKQEREKPRAVTIAFQTSGNRLLRYVNGRTRALPGSPSRLAELRKRLEELPPGPEKLRAAQELAKVLFVDIEDDLPDGDRTVLYQISEDDLLGSYSLVWLAELAGHPSAVRLQAFTEVYAVPPSSRDLEEILAEPSRLAEIGTTVVWISDHLAGDPRYAEVVAAIEAAGARVNELPAENGILVLLGHPSNAWRVTLRDGDSRDSGTEAFRVDLAKAGAVVAIGATLSAQDRSSLPSLHRIDATADHVLELGHRAVEAVRQGSGRESLDEAVRKTAAEETIELKELLASRGGLDRIEQSPILTAEYATLRSKT